MGVLNQEETKEMKMSTYKKRCVGQAEAAPGRAAHHADQVAAPTPGRLRQPTRIDEAHRAVGDVAVAVPRLRRARVPRQRVRAHEPAQRRVVDAPPAMDQSRPVQVLVARVPARARVRRTRQCGDFRRRQRRRPVRLAPAAVGIVGQRAGARADRARHALHRAQVVLVDVVHVVRRGGRLGPVIRRRDRRRLHVPDPVRHPRLPDRRVGRPGPRQQLLEGADVVGVLCPLRAVVVVRFCQMQR